MRHASELALEEINSAQHGGARIRSYDLICDKRGFTIAQRHKTVAISQTSAAQGLSALGDIVFRAGLTVDKLVPHEIQMTQQKLGYQRVATIADSVDLFSRSSQAVLVDSLKANDVEVLVTETFETGETNFTEQLTRVKESDPDAILISALSPEITAILIQGRRLGFPSMFLSLLPLP